ncbi:CalY family protein [Halobacillus salinarum]|uniref:CalY family protein n=1 Tax=Halobacillus salinarum TaxID=2932257 RepID=A0ABY4EK37_9BACI|nr:TasA family protein [Halobacillus salinarum]UOQ44539.1 CalY family protein [Halobacillus salinarum]
MSVKKKLAMGVMTGALGLSLVGGGTYAAFNDTATINNHFASGELDLVVGKSANKPISFDLTNMKPGDNVQRIFKLSNGGTLAIKDVLLTATASNFSDTDGDSGKNAFLSQFEVNFMNTDGETSQWQPREDVIMDNATLTLADLVNNSVSSKIKPGHLVDGKINLASIATGDTRGIPVDPPDTDDVFIQITFKDDPTKNGNNEYVQNKFMNASVDFYFNLEATQWDGVDVDSHNGNGAVNNGVQSSSDGTGTPDPKTDSAGGTHSEEVTD